MQVSRRKFFKICAGGMAGTSAAMLGFALHRFWQRHANINYYEHLNLVTPVHIVL